MKMKSKPNAITPSVQILDFKISVVLFALSFIIWWISFGAFGAVFAMGFLASVAVLIASSVLLTAIFEQGSHAREVAMAAFSAFSVYAFSMALLLTAVGMLPTEIFISSGAVSLLLTASILFITSSLYVYFYLDGLERVLSGAVLKYLVFFFVANVLATITAILFFGIAVIASS